jgi:hypothetical protein
MLDGILAHCVQKSEMELDYSGHLQTGDAELLMPESCYSDVKLKFISLSQVLKVTATQQPTIALRQGLHIQQRIGKPQGSSTEFLIMKRLQHHPTLQGLKQESSCLKWIAKVLCLKLPGLNDRNYSIRSPKSELTPWWTERGSRCDRMLGVV